LKIKNFFTHTWKHKPSTDTVASIYNPFSVKALGSYGENLRFARWSKFFTTSVLSSFVPQAIEPDNLTPAVTKSDRYEPTVNEAFEDFANHYQCTVIPARPNHPRDKSLVEGAVKIVYTHIYANLPKEPYTSLGALNKDIWNYLEKELNGIKMQGRDYSRMDQFIELEQKTLQPLPVHRYEFKRHRIVTVMKNAHVCLSEDKHPRGDKV